VLVKLLLAFAVPTVVLFALFAVVAYEVAHDDLEAELGTRLEAIASSAAMQIRGRYLVDLGPGDERDRAYLNTLRKLDAVREATGVARVYVFDRDFLSRADTADQVELGTRYFQAELDRHELTRVFDDGAATSSVLFRGADGALYKAGYAPVQASEKEPEIVLALAVDAPAAFFERLADLRRSLLVYGVVLTLIVLGISVVVATLITRPVRHLVDAAERIGRGDLEAKVTRSSRDEIGFLAETMEAMRRDLRARDVRLQLMLSGIAHEVRNPLGGIELFAGILRDELDPGDERMAHVLRIDKELGYLKTVVNEFLDYARRPAPQLADVDLAELAAEVVELLRAEAETASVTLACAIQAPSQDSDAGATRESDSDTEADTGQPMPAVAVRADAGQLRRVLLNLVRNAIQASAGVPDGRVGVTVGRARKRGYVEVENRGLPLPDEVRERMFEPFFTTREKGTGLGLAFVNEIVEDHGGEIQVVTGADETRFRVLLKR
jgi:signal transduction histidine kinase